MEDLSMNRHLVTRRDFLKTSAITAGTVALPYFVPASA
ncbi:MAG: twin-arginine translocation signal domain-containing protein [Phycisphaerae bacterium]